MTRLPARRWTGALLTRILAPLALALSLPAQACDPPAGRLVAADAEVAVRAGGRGDWRPIAVPAVLCEGDQVTVRGPGRAAVVLSNDVLVRVDQNTVLNLTRVSREADSNLDVRDGLIHVISRFRRHFGVQTPFVNALVEGTEFTVGSQPAGARVVVAEGRVRAVNPLGSELVSAGEAIEAPPGMAPRSVIIRPLDAMRWAIHTPQIVWWPAPALEALPPTSREAAATAQDQLLRGRAMDALATLEAVPPDARPGPIDALLLATRLTLGRSEEAEGGLPRLATQQPAAALALQALIAVTRNAPQPAQDLARQALAQNPQSPTAHLAMSYALQGGRDLTAALASAREATRLATTDPFAWARRAELELALSRLDDGAASARTALNLAPTFPRAKVLLAFADLLANHPGAALDGFDQALTLDSGDPLAHFGRGMALIRRGDLPAGRRATEIAVLLDPSNAEMRSYLGRMYEEESRPRVARKQLQLARHLDPASPTPVYFDALRQLARNNPLAALALGQTALTLNDQRAVLRTNALLDGDRAARHATLGTAYRELGQDQPMMAAADAALAEDPGNPAAHRLMAEAYAERPRFETARLSEVFQAEARQGLGEAPLPPQMQSRNLPIPQGPRALTPDETTALFDRSPTQGAAAVLAGGQEILGDSLAISRSWEGAQAYLGHFDYRQASRGLRDDISLTRTRGGVRLALGSQTVLQGDLSFSDRSGIDPLPSPVEGAGFLPDRLKQDLTTQRGRLTLRHAPSPEEELIVTAAAGDVRERTLDRIENLFSDISLRTHSQSREAGLLYGLRGASFGLLAGGGTYRESRREESALAFCCLPFAFPSDPPEVTHGHVEHNNAWAYLDLRPAPWATVHLGVSHNTLGSDGGPEVDRGVWKSGLSLRPWMGSTLRLGVFQGVKGPKYQDQTLEPTQFAGFTQVFDDLDGTRWQRQAVGLDQQFAGGATAGVEWSRRRLDVPGLGCFGDDCLARWEERLHRAYAALPIGDLVALSAAWQFERLRLNGDPAALPSLPTLTRTELLPLHLWVRLSHRASARLEALRVRQDAAISDGFGGTAEASPHVWLGNVRWAWQAPAKGFGVSVGLHNVFDRRFAFQNTDLNGDPRVPLFYRERTLLVQAQVRF